MEVQQTKSKRRNIHPDQSEGCRCAARSKRTLSKVAARGQGQVRRQLADWARHSWQSGWSHICVEINQEQQLGSKRDRTTYGSSVGKESLETSAVNTFGDCGRGRNSWSHRRVHWRDPQGPRMYTNPPSRESPPDGPNLLVGSGGGD